MALEDLPGLGENLIEHRLCEESGLRVPLARMVGCDHRERAGVPNSTVAELRRGYRRCVPKGPPNPKEPIHRNGAEYDGNAQVGEETHLALQVRLTSSEFDAGRFVLRGRTSDGRSDVTVPQLQPIVDRHGGWLICEAVAVKSSVQPIAATVSREDATRAISAMGCRRQADDEEARVRVAERRNGSTPVGPVPEGRTLRFRDPLPVPHEPRALAAIDDLRGNTRERIRFHSGETRFEAGAKASRYVMTCRRDANAI